jgi:cold shock CspA family protein
MPQPVEEVHKVEEETFNPSRNEPLSKSKSTAFPTQFHSSLGDESSQRTALERKESYKKKGMSSTSSAFIPPSHEKPTKAPSPPPGFDPLPAKPNKYGKTGYSSQIHPSQSLYNQNFMGMDKPSTNIGFQSFNPLQMMGGSQLSRLPSGTPMSMSMPKQMSFPSPMMNSSMAAGDKFSHLNSYMMAMPKEDPIPKQKNSDKISDFYRQYIDSLCDPMGKKQTGILKFFNDSKGFGFIVADADEKDLPGAYPGSSHASMSPGIPGYKSAQQNPNPKDIFFHFDDVKDSKLSKEFLRDAKNKYIVKFAYDLQVYCGKYNISAKAVNLELLGLFDQRFLLNSN